MLITILMVIHVLIVSSGTNNRHNLLNKVRIMVLVITGIRILIIVVMVIRKRDSSQYL